MSSGTFRKVGIAIIAVALGAGFVASGISGCSRTEPTKAPATTTR